MGIKFTGGFSPNISFRSRDLIPPPAPLPLYDLPKFYTTGASVYFQNSGFDLSADQLTATRRSGDITGNRNAAVSQTFMGGQRYFEWIVTAVSSAAYFGLGFIEPVQNRWNTGNALTSSSSDLKALVVTGSGALWKNGSLVRSNIFGRALQVGDVIGFAVDTRFGSRYRVSIHLNGTWASELTDSGITSGNSYLVLSEEARTAYQPILGSAVSAVGATLNGGQVRPLKSLEGFRVLGSPKGAVGLDPGNLVTALSPQSVKMTPGFSGFTSLSARASRTIEFNQNIYFEITINNVRPRSRFGFRNIRESDFSALGAGANLEVAWQPSTGTAFYYNQVSTGATALKSTVPVGGSATYGVAIRTGANYTGKSVWIRSPSGWQQASPLPGVSSTALQTYGDGGPSNMFCVTELYSDRGATWTINGGAQPLVYGAPTGFTPWDLS